MSTEKPLPQEHELKCWPEYFQAVKAGLKPFEVRKADRIYKVGDTLWLREFEPGGRYIDGNPEIGGATREGYTGDELRGLPITYILANGIFLQPGYVVLGLPRAPQPASDAGDALDVDSLTQLYELLAHLDDNMLNDSLNGGANIGFYRKDLKMAIAKLDFILRHAKAAPSPDAGEVERLREALDDAEWAFHSIAQGRNVEKGGPGDNYEVRGFALQNARKIADLKAALTPTSPEQGKKERG